MLACRLAGNGNVSAVRWMGVGTQQLDFAEFYRSAADECLRAVLVSIGDQDTASELVDEAFARAWASWRTVGRHPAPKAWVVRTALKDPAGLQATLRADGLPATVSFSGPMLSASCQPYEASLSTLRDVAQFHSDYLTIDPSALPSGAGVAIFDEPGTGLPLAHPELRRRTA
jgi:hypothetical protein